MSKKSSYRSGLILKSVFMLHIKVSIFFLLIFISHTSFGSETSYQSKEDSLKGVAHEYLRSNNQDGYYNALVSILRYFEYDGNWDKHDSVVQVMIDYGKRHQLPDFLTEAYNNRAMANSYNGNNSESLLWFTKSLEIFRSQNDSLPISNLLGNIAIVYTDMGMYEEALEHEFQSLRIRERLSHPKVFNNYSEISIIYARLGDSDNQLKYLNKAKEFLMKNDNSSINNRAILHNMLGKYYKDQNDIDSALFHYGKVHEYSQAIGWKRGMAVGLGNMAEMHYAKGDYQSALEENIKTLELSQAIEDASGIADQYFLVSKSYLALNNHKQAQSYAYLALEKAREHGFVLEEGKVLNLLSKIYEQKGQFQKSLMYYRQYHTISDSLTNIDKVNHIAELEKKFETEKKEHQIDLLSAENQINSQRIKLGSIVMSLLVLVLALGILLYVQRHRNAKAMETDLNHKVLRSQMNPHFIFNVLGSIQSFMISNEPGKASCYLSRFASLVRSNLEYSASESISLEHELEMLKNYIELEQMRMPGKFEYSIKIQNVNEPDFIQIPPMLIQPFIENAIKHGFQSINYKGELVLTVSDQVHWVEFVIEDNGIGLKEKPENESNHRSMAMNIFEQRRKLIQHKYKRNFTFEIINLSDNFPDNSGVCVKIRVPVLNNNS
jgi:tetratricopeptide (TPR) repeat protein